jgi:poly-beta-1,6-N-acetyl-D-glucosamine biosynthesis protein PgaD
MGRSLIINARHRLQWHHRLVSDASTAMMWGGWLWLWAPLVRAWGAAGARSPLVVAKLLSAAGPGDAIERTVVALAGTSGALLVWSRMFARTRRQAAALSVADCARHFALSEEAVEAGRSASICVVQHDDAGRIVQLECRRPLQGAPPPGGAARGGSATPAAA